ncbi:MAG: polyphenol oxidase family protein [candidate division WOR-3 bacterium]
MWKLIKEPDLKYFKFIFEDKVFLYSTKFGTEKFLEKFKPIMLKQIHSDIIVDIDDEKKTTGDGLITSGNQCIGVKVADCLPVYLFSKNRIAILHCGWRSIIKGILKKAKDILIDYKYVLGASIGPCCYEIKSDLESLYQNHYSEALIKKNYKIYLNLKKAVIIELGEKNLVADLDYCTYCNTLYFYSHRRGDKARNYAAFMKGHQTFQYLSF